MEVTSDQTDQDVKELSSWKLWRWSKGKQQSHKFNDWIVSD